MEGVSLNHERSPRRAEVRHPRSHLGHSMHITEPVHRGQPVEAPHLELDIDTERPVRVRPGSHHRDLSPLCRGERQRRLRGHGWCVCGQAGFETLTDVLGRDRGEQLSAVADRAEAESRSAGISGSILFSRNACSYCPSAKPHSQAARSMGPVCLKRTQGHSRLPHYTGQGGRKLRAGGPYRPSSTGFRLRLSGPARHEPIRFVSRCAISLYWGTLAQLGPARSRPKRVQRLRWCAGLSQSLPTFLPTPAR
jgi:hypothetical protein